VDLGSEETRRRYDQTVDLYERRYSEIQRQKYPRLMDMLDLPCGSRVLDWGCGTGLAFSMLEQGGHIYLGIDFSLPMLLKARERSRASLVLCDCRRLPFRPECFDGILGATVIQNIPSGGATFEELSRILKKGGRIVISYPKRTQLALPESKDSLKILAFAEINEDNAVLLARK
jgi:ubiquinone/menaquinone biosynthesis C-methylase UbiE